MPKPLDMSESFLKMKFESPIKIGGFFLIISMFINKFSEKFMKKPFSGGFFVKFLERICSKFSKMAKTSKTNANQISQNWQITTFVKNWKESSLIFQLLYIKNINRLKFLSDIFYIFYISMDLNIYR